MSGTRYSSLTPVGSKADPIARNRTGIRTGSKLAHELGRPLRERPVGPCVVRGLRLTLSKELLRGWSFGFVQASRMSALAILGKVVAGPVAALVHLDTYVPI